MSSKNNFYYTLKSRHPEVTASCFELNFHFPNGYTWKAMIDCGTAQENKYLYLNKASTLPNTNLTEAIFYTHSHTDHIGLAPALYKDGLRKNGYCSRKSKEAIRLSWQDSAKIYERDYLKELSFNKKAKKPLYDLDDVDIALDFLKTIEYNQTIEFETGNKNATIKVTFLDNGHIIGASCILFQAFYKSKTPISIFFTGDYKSDNTFKETLEFPKWVFASKKLTVVQESTYGARSNITVEERLIDYIVEAINNGKTVLIPCFSQERLQEILYKIKLSQDSNILTPSIPIIFDTPLGRKYTNNVYEKLSIVDFMPENVMFIDDMETREIVMSSPAPKIILTSSGMGDFGNTPHYLNRFLSDSSKVIIFCNFLPVHTLGRKILELPRFKNIRIPGYPSPVKKVASVFQTDEFSSHEKAPGLLDFLRQFSNLSNVIVNHGNIESKETYAKLVENELGLNVSIADDTCYHKINNLGECRTIKIPEQVINKKSYDLHTTKHRSKTPNNIPVSLRKAYSSLIYD